MGKRGYLGNKPASAPLNTADLNDSIVTAAKIADGTIVAADIADDAVGVAELSATGTASSSTFLRGDNSWQTAGSTSASDLTSGTLPIARIANDAIDSIHYAAGSVDLEHMSVNSIDSDQYVDGSIDTAHLAADSVDGTKIADDAINSEHYTDGSIDVAHMSVNSIDSDQYVDASIDEAHIANDAVNFATHLKAGTDGELITWDASGDPAAVAVGTSTHVLTSNGAGAAPTFQAAAGIDLTADQSWTGSQRATLVVDNDGSFDMNLGQNFQCTPSGNFTLTFTNHTNGQSGFIILINSGGHTVSLAGTSKADANLAATVTAAGTYILSYIDNGTNAYLTNSAIMA